MKRSYVSTRKRRILIVEDNDTLRESLRRLFLKEGHELVTTNGAEEGLGIVLGHLFDLILVDLRLPRSHGDRFIEQVRRLGCRSEIVMMTGYGSDETVAAVREMGARAVVTKDGEFHQKILDTVRSVLLTPQQAETAQ
jgi:two-component system, NtrC family, response regulator AtoC